MERVFSNLFENAIEAMRSGGTIAIRDHFDSSPGRGDSVMVRVEDTGPGISPALRGRLFQPFVTAGKKNGSGTRSGAIAPDIARSRRRHVG